MAATRASFLAGLGAAALVPSRARATGGLDVDVQAVSPHEIRVLLASGADQSAVARTLDAHAFAWGGRTYRGRWESVALADGRTGVIDVVPLDAYLYGVVSREIASGWPSAALRAQAIVARTYALGKLRPTKVYDIVAGESDQMYGGIDGETVQASAAVDATAGAVVMYGDRPAHIAYGSCCGGHTADAAELWGTTYPYLRGVADPHCSAAPDFRWQRLVPYDQFVRALGAQMASVGDLDRVDLRDLDTSWRPRRVVLVGTRGDSELKVGAFRDLLGGSVVRSTLLQSVIVQHGESVTLAGCGRGHGAGLCQWGTRFMAQDGASAEQIVQFYFPGTTLGRA